MPSLTLIKSYNLFFHHPDMINYIFAFVGIYQLVDSKLFPTNIQSFIKLLTICKVWRFASLISVSDTLQVYRSSRIVLFTYRLLIAFSGTFKTNKNKLISLCGKDYFSTLRDHTYGRSSCDGIYLLLKSLFRWMLVDNFRKRYGKRS